MLDDHHVVLGLGYVERYMKFGRELGDVDAVGAESGEQESRRSMCWTARIAAPQQGRVDRVAISAQGAVARAKRLYAPTALAISTAKFD